MPGLNSTVLALVNVPSAWAPAKPDALAAEASLPAAAAFRKVRRLLKFKARFFDVELNGFETLLTS